MIITTNKTLNKHYPFIQSMQYIQTHNMKIWPLFKFTMNIITYVMIKKLGQLLLKKWKTTITVEWVSQWKQFVLGFILKTFTRSYISAFELLNKIHIVQCMGEIFCVEFHSVSFKLFYGFHQSPEFFSSFLLVLKPECSRIIRSISWLPMPSTLIARPSAYHIIYYAWFKWSCLWWQRIITKYATSVLRNIRKCK